MGLLAASTNVPKFFEFQTIRQPPSQDPDASPSKNVSDDETAVEYFFWTTELYEEHRYIIFNSYNELISTGIVPLFALCFFNYKASIHDSCTSNKIQCSRSDEKNIITYLDLSRDTVFDKPKDSKMHWRTAGKKSLTDSVLSQFWGHHRGLRRRQQPDAWLL